MRLFSTTCRLCWWKKINCINEISWRLRIKKYFLDQYLISIAQNLSRWLVIKFSDNYVENYESYNYILFVMYYTNLSSIKHVYLIARLIYLNYLLILSCTCAEICFLIYLQNHFIHLFFCSFYRSSDHPTGCHPISYFKPKWYYLYQKEKKSLRPYALQEKKVKFSKHLCHKFQFFIKVDILNHEKYWTPFVNFRWNQHHVMQL